MTEQYLMIRCFATAKDNISLIIGDKGEINKHWGRRGLLIKNAIKKKVV